ncbi:MULTISPECIES: hypothetical protein [Desulfosediminicola]|uniref:hypothetical protein n=1 Tax=Desulfosediminicola TaxID=2886823 RepID=UPI0010AC7898|nr:hypothetical protein [Desulfosediminicola ganghwensis]
MKFCKAVPPKRKWLKEYICQIVLSVLGRALQSAAKFDHRLENEVAQLPEGFTIKMVVLPERETGRISPTMVLEKANGRLKYTGRLRSRADLTIRFNNLESAFLVLTPQMGAARAFSESRLSVVGDLAKAVALTRCLNVTLAYLYPGVIARRLVKRLPEPIHSLYRRRLYLYMVGIPFGR